MTSTTPKGKKLPQDHLDAAEQALTTVTENPTPKAGDDPKAHLHAPAAKEESHTWFRSIFPYNSLEEFENAWHLGNYVLDRKTGMKSFEEMSIYVRVGVLRDDVNWLRSSDNEQLGMHLLYYGSEQEQALHWKRTQDMLRDQSVKMGKQYDAPESKSHIQPFIESFQLQKTLIELKVSNFVVKKSRLLNSYRRSLIRPSTRPSTNSSHAS